MLLFLLIVGSAYARQGHQLNKETSVQLLSELPLDKLLRLKSSLQELSSQGYANSTVQPQIFEPTGGGAYAMALHGPPPIRRGGYEDLKKTDHGSSKIGSIFSLSVTTLAFLAFGGYLLCLIIQAVKYKSNMEGSPTQPATFFVSSGLKKRPQSQSQSQFASYGRRRRDDGKDRERRRDDGEDRERRPDDREDRESSLGPAPDELYSALLRLCEGYVKWDRLNLRGL